MHIDVVNLQVINPNLSIMLIKNRVKRKKIQNIVLASLNIDASYQLIVSDMTAFWAKIFTGN